MACLTGAACLLCIQGILCICCLYQSDKRRKRRIKDKKDEEKREFEAIFKQRAAQIGFKDQEEQLLKRQELNDEWREQQQFLWNQQQYYGFKKNYEDYDEKRDQVKDADEENKDSALMAAIKISLTKKMIGRMKDEYDKQVD